MEISQLEIKLKESSHVRIIEGTCTLTEEELKAAASSSGRCTGTGFEDSIKDAIADQLRDSGSIPRDCEPIACHLDLEAHTELLSWRFCLIASGRFAS